MLMTHVHWILADLPELKSFISTWNRDRPQRLQRYGFLCIPPPAVDATKAVSAVWSTHDNMYILVNKRKLYLSWSGMG